MAYGVNAYHEFTAHDQHQPTGKPLPQYIVGGVALACFVAACGWSLYAHLGVGKIEPVVAVVASVPAEPVMPGDPLFDVVLIHSTYSLGLPPVTFSADAALKFDLQAAAPSLFHAESRAVQRVSALAPPAVTRVERGVPLPAPRPAELAALQSKTAPLQAVVAPKKVVAAAVADNPFDKLFGKPDAGPALAYAAPDGGVTREGRSTTSAHLPPNDGHTAIYDISARKVYMPDGTKLEAHSGLRHRMDDPRYVHERMWGATPPHTYDLVARESLFHGVQAIRLIPQGGEGAIFGRTGLLAHTYMLGPNGDSNGCVSFKDYDAFLRAYQNNKVKRLVVVASLGQAPAPARSFASLPGRDD